MLYGIMPYLMEIQHKAKVAELQLEITERDRRIRQLEKIVAYDVEEIKSLKSRLAALGEPVERADYMSWQATMSDRIPRDGDQL